MELDLPPQVYHASINARRRKHTLGLLGSLGSAPPLRAAPIWEKGPDPHGGSRNASLLHPVPRHDLLPRTIAAWLCRAMLAKRRTGTALGKRQLSSNMLDAGSVGERSVVATRGGLHLVDHSAARRFLSTEALRRHRSKFSAIRRRRRATSASVVTQASQRQRSACSYRISALTLESASDLLFAK